MLKDVKIGFALVKGTNNLISVVKANKKVDYECFECHDLLVKVAGDKRKHHFRHKNASCNISRETCLHYGAKVYLKEMLEDGKQLTINIKTDVFRDTNLGKILKHANLNTNFSICSDKLYDNNCCMYELEKQIGDSKYKADLLTFTADGSIQMVWEIKVEHEIEPEKRYWLLENKIPFVELEPKESDEDDSFQFNLVSYGNINCFSQENFSLFNKEMYSIYGGEIHSHLFIIQHFKLFLDNFEEIINKSDYSPGFKEAVCKNYLEYDCAVKAAKDFLSKNDVFEFTQTNYRNGWDKDKELKNVDCVEYNKFELNRSKEGYFYFKINDNYWVDNPTCFCGEFLAELAKHIDVFGFPGKPKDKEITALRCNFFSKNLENISIKVPQNVDIPYWALNATNLSNIKFSGNGQFKVSMPNSASYNTVFNPDYKIANLFLVVKDLIDQMKEYCKIQFIVADSTKHNKRDVFGLKISGIYSVSKFNSEIIESVFKYVNKRLFAESKLNNKELGALCNSELMYWVDEESGERIKFNPEDKIEMEFIKKEVKQI